MKSLYLLRHGIAVPSGTPDLPDDDRPLTEKGERRVRKVANGLKSLKVELDKIITSPLPRAFRTAEIVSRVLGNPDLLEPSDMLRPDASVDAIAEWLKTREEEHIMLVGHNPLLSQLVSRLVLGSSEPLLCDLGRAGIAALSFAEPDATRMTIEWLARPGMIRRMTK